MNETDYENMPGTLFEVRAPSIVIIVISSLVILALLLTSLYFTIYLPRKELAMYERAHRRAYELRKMLQRRREQLAMVSLEKYLSEKRKNIVL